MIGWATIISGAAGAIAGLFVKSGFETSGEFVKSVVDAIMKSFHQNAIIFGVVTILVGGLLSIFLAPAVGVAVGYVSTLIGWAATQATLVTGVVVSVVIGMCLTLPISSAAICAGLGLTGSLALASSNEGLAIAGAAAVAGCCAQMVGFAVISFRDNGWGGLLSQGIGTSMLQMPNIMRHPQIWIAPTLASAITGPLAVCVFNLRMYGAAINSGMGTCGLLGPIGMILGWYSPENGYPAEVGALEWTGLVLVCFVLPAVLSLVINEILRKIGLVKDGDMKLDA